MLLPFVWHVAVLGACHDRKAARGRATWALSRALAQGELDRYRLGSILTSVSDQKAVNWHWTPLRPVATLVDLELFGLRRSRPRDWVLILGLQYGAALKHLGHVRDAERLYRALVRRSGKHAAFGYIGLGDLLHMASLWIEYVDAYDARGFTVFPLVGGFRRFLTECMGWPFAEQATLEEARRCYRAACDAAPGLAFARHELARVEADAAKRDAAAAAMTAFADMLAGSRTRSAALEVAEFEAARLRTLAVAPDYDASDVEELEHRVAARVRIVEIVPAEPVPQDTPSALAACGLPVHYRLYWRGEEHEIEKTLAFPAVASRLLSRAYVSGYAGAPVIEDSCRTTLRSTAYPFTPGRELFAPAYLGSTPTHELLALPTRGRLDDVVVLPGVADNYFHFLFDTVGALAFVDPELIEGRELAFFSRGPRRFQLDIFEMLGFDPGRLRVQRPGRAGFAARNVVVSDYPSPMGGVHPRLAANLRSRLLGRRREIIGGRRIYLARTRARSFAPEDRRRLWSRFAEHGFEVVHPELLSVAEQIELVGSAEAIAVDAGAGASNLLFASPGATVIMLGSLAGYTEAMTTLCRVAGLDLHVLLFDAEIRPRYLYAWCSFLPRSDLETFELCLRRALARPGATRAARRAGEAPLSNSSLIESPAS